VTKQEYRQSMLEKRKQVSPSDLKKMNDDLIQAVLNDKHFQDASSVAIYFPMNNEVNLLELLKQPKQFSFPKISDREMHFYAYDQHTRFIKSSFGVSEPVDGIITDESIDCMLVPALAISKNFYRIGYGKGYYDHFLSKIRPKSVMGVIYAFQEIDEMPIDAHDQQLDGYFKGNL
jgi:5-formyltetrahydrofolate cyclo-ligase